MSADSDEDGLLDEDEFYDFVVIRAASTCYESPIAGELSPTMQTSFSAIACTSCTFAGEGPLCCFRSREEARIVTDQIAAAAAACLAVDTEVYSGSTCQPSLAPVGDGTTSEATGEPSGTQAGDDDRSGSCASGVWWISPLIVISLWISI